MKTKAENRKFTLEKFEVAKLKNLKVIKGGSQGGQIDGTGDISITDKINKISTRNCL